MKDKYQKTGIQLPYYIWIDICNKVMQNSDIDLNKYRYQCQLSGHRDIINKITSKAWV